jgi:hypothetical protein
MRFNPDVIKELRVAFGEAVLRGESIRGPSFG